MRRTLRRTGYRGFTMVEVLAVIAIIAMLVGIMMPSLHEARRQARDFQCKNQLRELYAAHVSYINDYGFFPTLNKEADEGAWAYNYLIYDQESATNPGGDFESNFGPLVEGDAVITDIRLLYCPVQTDPSHSLSTRDNAWPVNPGEDTRAGYGRRYGLSGRSLSQIRRTSALLSDLLHIPKVVRSAHKTGLNVAYSDGHLAWVSGRETISVKASSVPGAVEPPPDGNEPPPDGDVTDPQNEYVDVGLLELIDGLAIPLSSMDNDTIEMIWHILDNAGR